MVVLFALFQTQNRSNGGLISMTHILEHIDHFTEPVIMTNTEGPFSRKWLDKGWKVHNAGLSMVSFRRQPLQKIRELWRSNYMAYRMLKRTDHRLLYCNDPQGFWYAGIGGRLAGARIIFNLRGTPAENEYRSKQWKWRLMGRWAERIIVLSHEMKKFVEHYMLDGRPDPKVQPIYSIVDKERFHPVGEAAQKKLRHRLGLPPGKKIVLNVGAFNAIKRQGPFLEAVVRHFKAEAGQVHFCFLGDFHPEQNPFARKCREIVRKRGLDKLVSFRGFIENVESYYKAADLVALASSKEGLPRCMIEGLACGRPVISFDVCSTREILETHRCGKVIPQGDYPAFTAALKELLHEDLQRQTMGRRGAEAIQALFSKEEVVTAYREFFSELSGLPVKSFSKQRNAGAVNESSAL
jgi:glycosyltransferase involved in cell wall biosynthesis